MGKLGCCIILVCLASCAAEPERFSGRCSHKIAAHAPESPSNSCLQEQLVSEQQALLQVGGARITKAATHAQAQSKIQTRNGTADSVIVRCETTKGPLKIVANPADFPIGVDRFLSLVRDQFFTDLALFRVVPQMFAQFGISDSHSLNDKWQPTITDDEPVAGTVFPKGTISFAGNGLNSRTTQMFIALADSVIGGTNPWETPVGHVVENLDVLDKLYGGYGDGPPSGNGPDQALIYNEGNAYLKREFSKLDYIKTCEIQGDEGH